MAERYSGAAANCSVGIASKVSQMEKTSRWSQSNWIQSCCKLWRWSILALPVWCWCSFQRHSMFSSITWIYSKSLSMMPDVIPTNANKNTKNEVTLWRYRNRLPSTTMPPWVMTSWPLLARLYSPFLTLYWSRCPVGPISPPFPQCLPVKVDLWHLRWPLEGVTCYYLPKKLLRVIEAFFFLVLYLTRLTINFISTKV